MILLLSGEGASDIGRSATQVACLGNNFQPGLMAHLVDQLLEPVFNYSTLEYAVQDGNEELLHFIPEGELKTLQPSEPKKLRLNGSKGVQGTKFHFKYAEILGLHAKRIESETGDKVIAVFFRDSDRTNSTPRTEWQDKWDSIESGFASAGFEFGVPMLPNPKSEGWILCALLRNYQNCESLENESGNDASPNSLKIQLAEILNGRQLEPTEIDAHRINMPSFNAFRSRLDEVAQSL
jgi:hypothetical protein